MNRVTPSMALWVYERLRDRDCSGGVWRELVDRYYPAVRGWAADWCPDPHRADDIAQEVFLRLKELIENPARRSPNVHPESGSFRPFLRTVVRTLAWNATRAEYRKVRDTATGRVIRERRVRPLGDDPDACGGGAGGDWVDDLIERWEYEDRLAERVREYAAALPLLRASPWYDPATFHDFLRVFRDGMIGVTYDDTVGRARGTTTVNANRVRDRLLDHMGWEHETAAERRQADVILREVLRRHDRLGG